MRSLLSIPLAILVMPLLPAMAGAPKAISPVEGETGAELTSCENAAGHPLEERKSQPSSSTPSVLELWADLDAEVRRGCARPSVLRAWQDGVERLAPFRREPDPDWRRLASDAMARLPIVSSSTGDEPSDWLSLGPTNISGRVRSLAVDPRGQGVLFAAAAGGGLWKSRDAGLSWHPLTDRLETLASGSVALDPSNPEIVYFGSGEGPTHGIDFQYGSGVFISTDGGESWRRLGERFARMTMKLLALPTDPVTLLAATEEGLFRITGPAGAGNTEDGPVWELVLSGVITDVVAGQGSLYAARGNPRGESGNGIFRSRSSGDPGSWSALGGGAPAGEACGRIVLATSPARPGTVVAGVQDARPGSNFRGLLGLFRTDDEGDSWQRIRAAPDYCSYPPPYQDYRQCQYDNVVAIDPLRPERLFVGGINIYRSLDDGATFSEATSAFGGAVHVDQHAFAFGPEGEFWVGNDGGVYRSTDGGKSFEARKNGLVTTQLYGIAASPPEGTPLLAGLQDNGSCRGSGEPGDWRMVLSGDGGPAAIDPLDPDILYAQDFHLNVFRSTNGGKIWSPSVQGIPLLERLERSLFIAPLVLDSRQPNRLVVGTHRVFLTADRASSWQPISEDLTASTGGSVSAIAIDPVRADRIFAGTSNGKVWRGTGVDSFAWQEVTQAPLPAGAFVKRIAAHPTRPGTVFVAYASLSEPNFFRTTDDGSSWKDMSGDLPRVPVSGIALDPVHANRVWVGTDVGVFLGVVSEGSLPTGGTIRWGRFGVGLPSLRVDELVFHEQLRRLRAATMGRGAWEVAADLPAATPLAAIRFEPRFPPVDEDVRFFDASYGTPDAWSWSFGDGTASAEPNPSHRFRRSGKFSVDLTVRRGSESSSTRIVVVVTERKAAEVGVLE